MGQSPEEPAPNQQQKDYWTWKGPAQEEALQEQRLQDDGVKGNGSCCGDPGLWMPCPTQEQRGSCHSKALQQQQEK